ncbi:MAG: polyhydroxyalkanoate synthesis repressor PhaR, partial [Rickettsiales bacterium TMED131]
MPKQKNAAAFAPPPEILIKKYANRRLYDTVTSRYITLSELSHMIRDEDHIRIEDAKTGEDLTRLTFIQIIQDYEQDGQQILPVEALRQIILAYGSGNESLLSRYLERTMEAFLNHKGRAEDALGASLDNIRSG